MKLKKILSFLLAITMTLSISSCANNNENAVQDESTTTQSAVNADFVGHTESFDGLSILINRTETLNPLLSTNKSVCTALNLLYQNIVSFTEDNKVSLNLLESYEYSAEANTFTLKVKNDILWDDNTRLTADDLVYSFNVLRSAPADVYYKNVIKDITSFTKTGSDTIRVTVSSPNAGNPYFLAFPVIPQHKKDTKDLIDAVHLNTVVGNGVYTNSSVSINNVVYLEDNTLDSKNPIIKKARLIISDTNDSIYYGFEQGLSNVLTTQVSKWSKYHTNKSVNINSYTNMEMVLLGFNFKNPVVNDINFRNAVYHSIPFEQIANSIYLGYCNDSRTVYPKKHFAYNVNIINDEFDGLKADEFIKKTGYDGKELKLITLESDKELKKTAEIIKANLEIINVKVNLQPLSYEDFMSALSKRDYDIYVGNFNMSVLPDITNLVGKSNYSNYNNEGLAGLIDKLRQSKSYDEYQNTAFSIQSIIFTEKPIIPIIHKNDAIITSKNYISTVPQSYDNPYQNVDQWHLDGE